MKSSTKSLALATALLAATLLIDHRLVHSLTLGLIGRIWWTCAWSTFLFFLIHLTAWVLEDLKARR